MIKAVTKQNIRADHTRKMKSEITVAGTKLELLHEFMGILD